MANIGQGQLRKDGRRELPVITCGDTLEAIKELLPDGRTSYSSMDVMRYLNDESPAA